MLSRDLILYSTTQYTVHTDDSTLTHSEEKCERAIKKGQVNSSEADSSQEDSSDFQQLFWHGVQLFVPTQIQKTIDL